MAFKDSLDARKLLLMEKHLKKLGIKDPHVLRALRIVPRHIFVEKDYRKFSYQNTPLPIGYKQTISQPYIVALMTQEAFLKPNDKVLEIGTGCGYQTAILACLCKEVYTIEIIEPLAKQALQIFHKLHYTNVHTRIGDGHDGWPQQAPFDVIIVTAAPKDIPQNLIHQLKEGGRLIVPIGHTHAQDLFRITKTSTGIKKEYIAPVRFVPMTTKNDFGT